MSSDWESRYQAKDTPWEKGAPSPPLVEWLTGRTLSGRILVPGCGTGHDVRALAQAGARVVGLDLAPSAVALAQTFPRVGLEMYLQGDLFALPDDWSGTFDRVVEHTCFCAIDPSLRQAYVEAIHRILRPGGRVLAVFYMDPGNDDGEGPPFGSQHASLEALFSGHFRWISLDVPKVAFPGREGREMVVEMERVP